MFNLKAVAIYFSAKLVYTKCFFILSNSHFSAKLILLDELQCDPNTKLQKHDKHQYHNNFYVLIQFTNILLRPFDFRLLQSMNNISNNSGLYTESS